jgi:hypothetical protein
MITKQIQPYELLVRWNNGVMVGAHVQFITKLIEDGTVLNERVGDAMPINVGQGKGFPLADILQAVTTDALIRGDLLEARVQELESEKSILDSIELQAAETDRPEEEAGFVSWVKGLFK